MKGIDWKNIKSTTSVFIPKKMKKVSEIVKMKEDVNLRH